MGTTAGETACQQLRGRHCRGVLELECGGAVTHRSVQPRQAGEAGGVERVVLSQMLTSQISPPPMPRQTRRITMARDSALIHRFARFVARSEHTLPTTIEKYRSDFDAFAAWFEGVDGEPMEPAELAATDLTQFKRTTPALCGVVVVQYADSARATPRGVARFGRIDRSNLGSIDFGVVGPKRARPLHGQA